MVFTWSELKSFVALQINTLLYGPPGTGKTTVAMQSATDGKSPVSLTLTAETPAAELRGHYIPKGSEFVWQDGPAITAWRRGLCLVLNEINEASGDALTFLYALLDDPSMASITLPTGETVHPAPGFYCVATMNGQPSDLPPALLDRFLGRVLVDTPCESALKNVTLASAVLDTLGHDPTHPAKVSLRQARAFDLISSRLSQEMAAKAVFGDRHGEIIDALQIAKAAK
jgi:MoxR-like ATPase